MAATPEHAARVLGLGLDASLEDIRRVRRKMALKYHPDRCHDKELATRHMGRINAAVDTLTAYIKSRAKAQQARKSRRAAGATSRKQAPASSARPEKTKTTSRTRQSDVEAGFEPEKPKPASRAEIALVRFASDSYTSVLERIGRRDTGPRIDVSILSFQGAHS